METPSKTNKKSTPLIWLTIIAFILSITAIIVITISWIQLHHLQTNKSQSQALQTAQYQQLLSTISQLQSQIQSQQQTIDMLGTHLGNSALRLRLTQVAAQLNLANLQLTMNNDIDGALVQLKNISANLNNQHDSRLLPLQRAINSDITRLNNQHEQNTPQLLSQIDTLSQAVHDAHFIPLPITHTTTKKPSTLHSHWYQKLWSQLKQTRQLIVIRHHGPDLTPLLDPTQQEILRTLIQGRLLLCEYAVIHRNDTLLHQQVSQIKDWIQTLMLDSSTKDKLLKMVAALQTISLSQSSSNLNQTIDLLNGLISSNKSGTLPALKTPIRSATPSPSKPQAGIAI